MSHPSLLREALESNLAHAEGIIRMERLTLESKYVQEQPGRVAYVLDRIECWERKAAELREALGIATGGSEE